MKLVKLGIKDADRVAPLVADFRVTLNSFKGINSEPDIESGKEEIAEFIESDFPVFGVENGEELVGYVVCRIIGPCLWVEHIFVCEEYRRKGVATMLFNKAEEIGESLGGDTVFNYVHPNNHTMIQFLRSKGYTVLNLIEIRKPFNGEKTATTVRVDDEIFDY